MQKLHIGRVGSTSSSSSSRADNYNAYHKLAVAVAEVWGLAIKRKAIVKPFAESISKCFVSDIHSVKAS